VLGIGADLLGTVATFYGVGAAATALLQARQILRRKDSCGVSARFFATYAGGYAIWLLYGMSIGSVPLILVDLVGLLCGGFVLAITLALRGSLVRPTTWNMCPE
jgi:MtN3 and saliva related transmembrane protein